MREARAIGLVAISLLIQACQGPSPLVKDKYFLQSLESEDGWKSTTVYDSGSGQRVFGISALPDGTEMAKLYVGGREAVQIFNLEQGQLELLGVAVGEGFPRTRIVGIEREDGKSNYLQLDLPSGGKEFTRYYDLDRNGSFDAMVNITGKQMWVLVANAWVEVQFEPKALLLAGVPNAPSSVTEMSSARKLVFEKGLWTNYKE